MEKKFKCQACGQTFIGDTSKYVVCPNCQSDNVSLAKSTSPALKYGLIGLGAVAIVVGAVFGIKAVMKSSDTSGVEETAEAAITEEESGYTMDLGSATQESKDLDDKVADAVNQALPVELAWDSTTAPKHDVATNTYSFTAKAKLMGSDTEGITIEYFLRDFEGKEIAKSTTGEFKGIKPIKDTTNNQECTYILVAQATGGNTDIKDLEKDISGFVDIPPKAAPVPKLTVQDVQTLINKRAGAAEIQNNPSIDRNCKVICLEGADIMGENPKSLSKLIGALKVNPGAFVVTVVGLDYADNNKVTCVRYKVTAPNN